MATEDSRLERLVKRSLEITFPIVKGIGTAVFGQIAKHQGAIGTLLYSSSVAAIGAAFVDDYTYAGFVESAVLTGTAIASMKGLELILTQAEAIKILPERIGKRYAVTSGIVAAMLVVLGTDYANMTEAEGVVEYIKEVGKAAYVTTLLYAGFETARYGYQKMKQGWQTGNRWLKNLARVGIMSTTLLSGLSVTNTINLREYDPTPYGIQEERYTVDPSKLDNNLTIKSDMFGEYASVQLKEGESLYSAIILQYTDFLEHDDVMHAARRILTRSLAINNKEDRKAHGFRIVGSNARNLHVGDEIKIPLSMLSDRYRQEETIPKSEEKKPKHKIGSLKEVHVLLDAGHGGDDPGSSANGVIEDEVAYDIMTRIKKILEEKHSATVHPFIEDKTTEFNPQKELRTGRNEVILTTPEYKTGNVKIAANLRAYKANYLHDQLIKQGVPEENIVFISVHSDALTPQAEGLMVYYPDATLRTKSLTREGGEYSKRKEVSTDPTIEIEADKYGSERASYALAEIIVQQAQEHGVVIHTPQPIRGKIRNKGTYSPAVIRYNPISTKLLLEVGNCKNTADAARMLDPKYRQKIAESYVSALEVYYQTNTSGGTQR